MGLAYSEEKRGKVLECLEKSGGNVTNACQACRITTRTFYRWMDEGGEFYDQADDIINRKTELVVTALFDSAIGGNVTAQIFILKNRQPEKWRDVQQIEGKILIDQFDQMDDSQLAEYVKEKQHLLTDGTEEAEIIEESDSQSDNSSSEAG